MGTRFPACKHHIPRYKLGMEINIAKQTWGPYVSYHRPGASSGKFSTNALVSMEIVILKTSLFLMIQGSKFWYICDRYWQLKNHSNPDLYKTFTMHMKLRLILSDAILLLFSPLSVYHIFWFWPNICTFFSISSLSSSLICTRFTNILLR